MSPTKLKSPGSYESADSKIGLRQCHTDSKFSKNPQKTKEKTIKKIVKQNKGANRDQYGIKRC